MNEFAMIRLTHAASEYHTKPTLLTCWNNLDFRLSGAKRKARFPLQKHLLVTHLNSLCRAENLCIYLSTWNMESMLVDAGKWISSEPTLGTRPT